ncbi:MAG TPA: hypothetical protein VE690_07165 [Rhodopila sp.]|nr:hypothetical protein [Rhodopila sp.]
MSFSSTTVTATNGGTSSTSVSSIQTGSGNNYINASQSSGSNVINAGAGSNFIIGGSGSNTVYLDARHPTTNVWDTVAGLHAGDSVTVWGVSLQDFRLAWLDGQGAPGATGLTAVFTAPDAPAVALTLAGYTSADLANGHLSVTYGTTPDQPGLPGSTYMHVQVA